MKDYYEIKCPHCNKTFQYRDPREDGLIDCLFCGLEIEIQGDCEMEWQPIETAPKDGTFILLAGNSGYTTTPLRVSVGRYYPEYRPNQPWVDHANDSFLDDGGEPIFWAPLLEIPVGGKFDQCDICKRIVPSDTLIYHKNVKHKMCAKMDSCN